MEKVEKVLLEYNNWILWTISNDQEWTKLHKYLNFLYVDPQDTENVAKQIFISYIKMKHLKIQDKTIIAPI